MIQANELRIGNIVIGNGYRGGKMLTIDQIGGTATDDGDRIVKFKECEKGEYLKDCEGIPLSPELLEACGFQWDEDSEWGGWLSPDHNGEQYRIQHRGHFFWLPNKLSNPVRLEFFHQLQNWYFVLTNGSELSVNLEKVKA